MGKKIVLWRCCQPSRRIIVVIPINYSKAFFFPLAPPPLSPSSTPPTHLFLCTLAEPKRIELQHRSSSRPYLQRARKKTKLNETRRPSSALCQTATHTQAFGRRVRKGDFQQQPTPITRFTSCCYSSYYTYFFIQFAETGLEEAVKNNLLHCCLLSSLEGRDKVRAFRLPLAFSTRDPLFTWRTELNLKK